MRAGWIFLSLIAAVPAWAQNDLQANVNLQFRFTNPGARAQAMGGAFVGLADDTTAIFANPAGLATLSSSTVALELNTTRYDNEIPFYQGRIEQTGLQDFRFDLQSRDFANDVTGFPFLGYVSANRSLKWGVFYAELANFDRSFETAGVAIPPFSGGRDVDVVTLGFFSPSTNFIELNLRALGASIAGNITDKLAGGVTLGLHQLEYRGNTTLQFPDFEALFPEINFSERDLAPLRPLIGQPSSIVDIDGDESALSIYAGLLYMPSDRFHLGLAYKRQPEFDYDYDIQSRNTALELVPLESGTGVFNVPDNYGVGFSFRPTDTFILSVEVNRVLYSELSDDFTAFFANPNDPTGAGQRADDATEYRLGAEYFITSFRLPLALRAGYWFEPYHALQNTTTDTQLLFRFQDENGDFIQDTRPSAFLQQFAQDQNHITFGLGLSMSRKVALDISGDIAEETQTFSLSGNYRF